MKQATITLYRNSLNFALRAEIQSYVNNNIK